MNRKAHGSLLGGFRDSCEMKGPHKPTCMYKGVCDEGAEAVSALGRNVSGRSEGGAEEGLPEGVATEQELTR